MNTKKSELKERINSIKKKNQQQKLMDLNPKITKSMRQSDLLIARDNDYNQSEKLQDLSPNLLESKRVESLRAIHI